MSAGNCSIVSCVPPSSQGLITKSEDCHYTSHVYTNSQIPNDCGWAYKVPEVRRASSLAHVCSTSKPKRCRIKTNIKPIIQNGPTCGLTALNMLTGGILSTDDILTLAKRKQFTNHGEMFCTKNLNELAKHIFASIDYPVSIQSYSGELNCDCIKTELMNGACLLVAYPFQKLLYFCFVYLHCTHTEEAKTLQASK